MCVKLKIFGFIIVLLIWGNAVGQTGDAGVESPFSVGSGARSLGLGNAMVAFPDDASAFFWNPAGMVVVDQRHVDVSLATFFEGTQYNFVGYIHPTLNIGVLGLGITRIGTEDIEIRSWESGSPEPAGYMNYWWGKLTLSYARTLFRGFSLGINFDVHRQVLGNNSANGFDVDFGSDQSEKTLLLMRIFDIGVPLVTSAIAVLSIYFYRITEEKAHLIRLELEKRRGKATAAG